MNHLLSLLALDHPDWTIPWAGIGAALLGVGGVLSGLAALITARNKGRDEKTIPTTVSRPVDDVRRRISSSYSDEPDDGPTAEDSNR